ncbi:hypothetical protein V7S43_012722 [Phytophthora oleae]|uniref:PiggyBac transposable element-derived protein domain-containing protein n=1 Tax=Phytophthora oleae TaxID=2107226 RepID=A0ABD3FA75_9STRA
MYLKHGDHDIGCQKRVLREERSSRIVAKTSPGNATKRDAPSNSSQPKEKRQKRWWKTTVTEITGNISRWLIRDGLPYNVVTTPAFRTMIAGLTGEKDVPLMSSKTYNDIASSHYAKFRADTRAMLIREHEELLGTPYMNLMHDLWTNSSKNDIVGGIDIVY